MERSHPPQIPESRLILIPVLIGLFFLATFAGYLGNNDSYAPAPPPFTVPSPVTMQTSRTYPQETPEVSVPPAETETGSDVDPVIGYKQALALLDANYYGPPLDSKKTRQLTYEAIRGMLTSLRDQFTTFLDPAEWSQMQALTKGDFEGIGAYLDQKSTGFVRIVRPIPTSSAEKAGLQSGDQIVAVNGRSVRGKEMNEVIDLIKGPLGTHIKLGILRGNQTLSMTVTRTRVEPPVVQHWMEDNQYRIGHIVLSEFNERSMEQLNSAFHDLERQKMKALVFDMRSNPGGLLDTAVSVASVFVPADSADATALKKNVVILREGGGQEKGLKLRPYEHTHGQLPLVVLVNGNSASASEIVTGAIKDYGVGTIIGERTYGKGRVQTLIPMDDHSALRLTTQLYYPPRHTDINFRRDELGMRIPGTGGIAPDIEVKQSAAWKEENFRDKTNDLQLQTALCFLRARLRKKTVAEASDVVKKASLH
jgi:carboxyl-terminal processing protease